MNDALFILYNNILPSDDYHFIKYRNKSKFGTWKLAKQIGFKFMQILYYWRGEFHRSSICLKAIHTKSNTI